MSGKKICIFWSSITFLQPSHYPNLFREVEKICKGSGDTELIDVSLLTFKEIEEKATHCDVIVIDHSIKYCYSIVQAKTNFNFILKAYHKKDAGFYLAVFDYLFSISQVPKIFMLHCDMHALKSDIVGRFDGLGKDVFEKYISKIQAIVWVFRPEYMKDVNDLPVTYRDPFMLIKDGYFPPKENARRIREMVPTVIEVPLCVSSNEIHKGKRLHLWDVSVIGDGYLTRKIAKQNIQQARGVSLAPYYITNRVKNKVNEIIYKSRLAGADRITGFNLYTSHLIQDFFLKRSCISFTCGSGYMYFVRKFFEIPASGSVLVGYTPGFASDYGFVHEKNYVFSEPENVVEPIRFLKKHPAIRQALKKNAWNLVEELHSTEKRAEQLLFALSSYANKPYKEARFAEGRYTLIA
ncbi:MAG TPA: glycosyltransferase [Chitinophagaceae bacterium]|nr:glycosyltransferase [Chitinophagaceae bacterium]